MINTQLAIIQIGSCVTLIQEIHNNNQETINQAKINILRNKIEQISNRLDSKLMELASNQINNNRSNQARMENYVYVLMIDQISKIKNNIQQVIQQNGLQGAVNNQGFMNQNISLLSNLLNKQATKLNQQQHVLINHCLQDASAIMQRAPKLIIQNQENENVILQSEKVYINAFGVVNDLENLNQIPQPIEKTLERLAENYSSAQILASYGNSNELLLVQQYVIENLLRQ